MIKLSELEVGGIYIGKGRNFSAGIWTGSAFLGARYKFGYRADTELHYDADKHHGTFVPLTLAGKAPEGMSLLRTFNMSADEATLKYPGEKFETGSNYAINNDEAMNFMIDFTKQHQAEIEAAWHG